MARRMSEFRRGYYTGLAVGAIVGAITSPLIHAWLG